MGIKRFLPQTLLGRSLLIVVLPVLILQGLTVYIFLDRHWSRMVNRLTGAVAGDVAMIVQMAEDGAYGIPRLQELANIADLGLTFEPNQGLPEPEWIDSSWWKQSIRDQLAVALHARLKNNFVVAASPSERQYHIFVVEEEGSWQFTVPERRLYSSSSYIFLLWTMGLSLILTIISLIFLRNQIRPIRKLAAAAERFGRGLEVENFKPEGAREVRAAARAFIDMRERLKRQIDQRVIMLAGISHDIRTPLTRLKLGLNLLDDQPDVQALKKDVVLMEQMLHGYLEFVADGSDDRSTVTDLSGLVDKIVSEIQRSGAGIQAHVTPGIILTLRPVVIRRAIENILSNARRYGSQILVTLTMQDTNVTLVIEDNGPGMDPKDYERALKPFVRLDAARTIQDGSVGLGLAIALDAIQSHGGTLTLGRSAQLGGLQVTIEFPR